MLTSFLLQLVFLGLIINIVYEKFNSYKNRFEYSSGKEIVTPEITQLNQEQNSFEASAVPHKNSVVTEIKTNNNFSLVSLVIIIIIGLFSKKKNKRKNNLISSPCSYN